MTGTIARQAFRVPHGHLARTAAPRRGRRRAMTYTSSASAGCVRLADQIGDRFRRFRPVRRPGALRSAMAMAMAIAGGGGEEEAP
ncbi:hypothetical protein FRAHR75_160005 [Frankia sp. Hr75.2]|nr:hypothetical protein FRAHR75_160005 [Frankia sp. Hr75.2]